jgi:hypothetical protein
VIGWGSSTLNMLEENEVQCHHQRRAKSARLLQHRQSQVRQLSRESCGGCGRHWTRQSPSACIAARSRASRRPCRLQVEDDPGGIQVRSKDEMKEELGRSPDDGDAVIMAKLRRRGMWATVFTGPQGIAGAPKRDRHRGRADGWLTSR